MPLILLTIGLVLIIYNYRAIKIQGKVKQEDNSLNITFQSVLQDNKEGLNDYKMEIGILRRDIAESLTELQEEILDIKNNLDKLKNNEKLYDNVTDIENNSLLNRDKIDVNANNEFKVEKTRKIDKIIGNIGENLFADLDKSDEKISENDVFENVESSKTQNIRRLLRDGLTQEEICHRLSVSKGEILLVKGLFKK